MSGGAVIDLGKIADPAALAAECYPLLGGLFIEFHPDHGAIVATRLGPILQAIRDIGSGFRVSAGTARPSQNDHARV
jgi:hypothetical protein